MSINNNIPSVNGSSLNPISYKHWRLETDIDDILWIYFDKTGEDGKPLSVNTIDRPVMEEFSQIVDSLILNTHYAGVILTSAKKSGFIAGADIAQFTQFKDIDEATNMLRLGDQILGKLESLKMKTVAMIDGFCLGGGLEMALACRFRVVEESAKTRLGLPEIKLGIMPGWGGTVRLPRKMGAMQGLNMILSGHTVSGKAAAKLGIADVAVPRRELVRAAKYYILNNEAPKQLKPWVKLQNNKLSRQVLGHFMRKKLRAKVNPMHYPAPFDVINNWEHMGVDTDAAFEQEAKTCGKLFFSETCHNLVRVFFLQDQLKALAKKTQFTPTHIHVIGGGTMGGDIAAWCALQGFHVTLQDLEPKFIAPAFKRAYVMFKEKLKEPHLIKAAMDRLIGDVKGEGVKTADIIIEAVVEDLSIKQSIFKEIEKKAKPDAILATNTSSIPLDEINTVLEHPEDLIGIHFFNPVDKMMLVEVVKGQKTSAATVENAIAFVRQIDHLPLPVKSSPGFLVNRILMPYLLESMVLVNSGVPISAIDKAMTDFGMPMGPITLADTVGLDVCLSVAKHLSKYYPTPIPTRLTELVAARKLGRKTGEGFYQYDKKGNKIKPLENAYDKPLKDIADRLVLCMLNEAFACLREGVVENADLLDAGMIFGTGFAPFRGGPIHYAKTQGIDELYQQFLRQQQKRGNIAKMPEAWEMAE